MKEFIKDLGAVEDAKGMMLFRLKEVVKELIKDIIAIKDVIGVVFFSFNGEAILNEFSLPFPKEVEKRDLRHFLSHIDRVREANLFFEKGKLFVKRTDIGYLMVLTGNLSSLAKIRIQSDLLLPTLTQMKTKGEFKDFFKKGR